LSDTNGITFREVTRSGSVVDFVGFRLILDRSSVHSVDRSHSTVLLETLAFVVEELSGRFGRSGEESSHHDSGSSEGESLGDVTDVRDTSIGDDGYTELTSKLGDGEYSGSLRSTDGGNFLSDTD
jgi:hypothetical protein